MAVAWSFCSASCCLRRSSTNKQIRTARIPEAICSIYTKRRAFSDRSLCVCNMACDLQATANKCGIFEHIGDERYALIPTDDGEKGFRNDNGSCSKTYHAAPALVAISEGWVVLVVPAFRFNALFKPASTVFDDISSVVGVQDRLDASFEAIAR
jgi:hypothetical protein